MEEKDDQMYISEDNSSKSDTYLNQLKKISRRFESKKRKANQIKIFSENISDRKKIFFNKIFNLNDESLNDNDKKLYTVIEMTENDKKLMECFNFLMNHPDLELNKKISLNILNQETSLILKKRGDISLISINDKYFFFEIFGREIIFVDEKNRKKTKRFIYNLKILENSLEELGFKSYYVKIPKKTYNNNNSEIDINNDKDTESSEEISLDPSKIYYDQNIKFIYNENEKPILSEENFNKKFNDNIFKLKDLNNVSKYYYKNEDDNFFGLNNYGNANDNFYFFKNSSVSKILYLYGPKRCSKTTFLLYMINLYGLEKINTLYFNYDYLEKENKLQIKKIIYHELLYFCKDIEEIKKIEKKKVFNDIIDKDNIMELIYLLLKTLFEIINVENKIKRIIIIDNIYCNDEYNLNYLEKVITIIKTKSSNVKLILCGNGPYFNTKFIDFYEGNNILTNNDKLYYKEFKEIFYIYNADKDEINKVIKENEKKENEIKDESILKKKLENNTYSFYGLYFSEELDKKIISYKTIMENKKFISQLPLEYFEIKILKNEMSFNFYNDSLKACIKNIIGFEIEKGTLTRLLKSNNYPRTFFGICFEKLITLLLKHNKLNLLNLKFHKNNIIEIPEIAQLKKINYSGPIFNLTNKDEPILVIQENFFGPLYDLLIITKRNNKYYSDFVQIGVDKTEREISDIINDLESKYDLYKSNILNVFGINSDFISAVFIFDYKTQKNKDYSNGFQICKNRNINFYLFSLIDCSLIVLNENKDHIILIDEYDQPFLLEQNKKAKIIKKKKKENFIDISIDKYFHH